MMPMHILLSMHVHRLLQNEGNKREKGCRLNDFSHSQCALLIHFVFGYYLYGYGYQLLLTSLTAKLKTGFTPTLLAIN